MAKYFPLFVSLEQKKIVVVGGGAIATRRVQTLLGFECSILVISPVITDELSTFVIQKKVDWIQSEYDLSLWHTLKEVVCVIATTNHRKINHQVYLDAKKKKIWVNVCDAKEECDFYFPGIVTGESVVIGITASGTNHKLAKCVTDKIRKEKKELIGSYEESVKSREQRQSISCNADKNCNGSD